MVRLYIENIEIELDETVQFAITKQFEDLTNPTTIINDWSKTVSIPFTVKNHRTFGYIYNPDKVTVASNSNFTGVYFDPLKKLDFRLEWNGAVLMTGYAKMNEIKQVDGNGSYEITLFGQLGKIFQEMSKITFDTTSDLSTYIIDGSTYVDETIDRNLVKSSWDASTQSYSKLYPKWLDVSGGGRVRHPAYKVTDIIGFAPNNSFSSDFKYDTFQASSSRSMTFVDYLNDSLHFESSTGINAETVIPNGFLPREFGEFRSYLLLPYIYWNKLFQVFQYKSEEITGYEFVLDSSWFNDSNPYWHDLVYMLKPFNLNNSDKSGNAVNKYGDDYRNDFWDGPTYKAGGGMNPGYLGTVTLAFNNLTLINEAAPIYDSSNGIFNINSYSTAQASGYIDLELYALFNSGNTVDYSFVSTLAVILDINIIGNASTETKKYVIAREGTTNADVLAQINSADGVVYMPANAYASSVEIPDYCKKYWNILVPISFNILPSLIGTTFSIQYSIHFLNHYDCPFYNLSVTTAYKDIYTNIKMYNEITINLNNKYSYSNFTLNDLWNKDYNLFKEILKYCKMYRILVSVDDTNKKINFQYFPNYFNSYSIIDWTNKVDKKKDFVIKPITFENKYVLFNYKDSKTTLGEEYKKKYGINYGDYRLITDYNFNTETTNLFENITPSIVATDNVLSYYTLAHHKIAYTVGAEIFPYNKDKDKKLVDIFGAYFFHNGLANFDYSGEMLWVNISDDSQWQIDNLTYFYTMIQSDKVSVLTYPNLDIVRNNNMCVFNVPKDNYTYLGNYSNANTIYSNFWSNYISERYNVQNKLITCYVKITPIDFMNIAYNKFVKIGNQICIINKIYNYDINSSELTKVDLITIQDVSAYTSNNFEFTPAILTVTPNNLTIPYDYTKRVLVHSTGNWDIRDDDTRDYVSNYPREGEAGDTWVYLTSIDENMGAILDFRLYDDNYNILTTKSVVVSVGGTNTITVSNWYNEVTRGSTVNITITSDTPWSIVEKNNVGGISAGMIDTSGGAGTTTISAFVPLRSNTGFCDYYVKNENDDIVSFRIYVV